MTEEHGRRPFSVTLLFASFFGALMIAAAFAYFNYKFSEYKFINFNEWVLYEKEDIFHPKASSYTLLFYNSTVAMPREILTQMPNTPILAIDYAQKKFPNEPNITYVTAPTNTLLSIIQRFNIYKVPTRFVIVQSKESLYKQDSMIEALE
ncbi:MAG: hypothetical protein KU28_01095 [Sulfurovum sp. PC08-66]|nr:MAG: hypothetical protein KU28_01095 [Sulfurovum sp. PC08-66]KIM12552.1 MAG: hypothetical protein KU37_01210 [Sulfuricurvum sp. PC08-66]